MLQRASLKRLRPLVVNNGIRVGVGCYRCASTVSSSASNYASGSKSNGSSGAVKTSTTPAAKEVGGDQIEVASEGDKPFPQEPYLAGDDGNSDATTSPADRDWSLSFHGIGSQPFSKEAASILMAPLDDADIEVKPDGLLYLPEIKYRRILNKAFSPGGWGLCPRGPHSIVGTNTLTREYALIVLGRFVSQARGEQQFFSQQMKATATEGVKSNALMRCCKDLGIASELWDPAFIRKWKAKFAKECWVLDQRTSVNGKGPRKRLWRRVDEKFDYPYQEIK
ncbi:hypothetical protein MIR68_003996 [Amoeboaphelidium protococcarum]|nr:hypothetical protein MIR68_003996 [Amoeboaphelidium protococcarum]